MNIAITLAVSKYSNPGNNLPASKKDGEIMASILENTKKFDKVLTINENQSSSAAKQLLSNFFVDCKGLDIQEVFFYYSGHGEFMNDEFYYLLSDYDPKKRNQTSLQNREVDDLIRTLTPQIVIKFVDACQSGTNYIKENDFLSKYFNETKKGFNNCYFLNSSLSNQSSYQDENLSFFTLSFVKALRTHPESEIRYKDIIDYILDDFSGNVDQTPFFVIQADMTEKFCQISPELKRVVSSSGDQGFGVAKEEKRQPTLLDLVVASAKDYVDKNGALEAMEFCRNKFNQFRLDEELKDLYDVQLEFIEDNNTLPGMRAIGKWLIDNPNEFFASPKYVEPYDEFGEPFERLTGYTLEIVEAPFRAIRMDFMSKFPNIKSYQCIVAILISKKLMTFFYSMPQFIDSGWDGRKLNQKNLKWTYADFKIAHADSISAGIKNLSDFVNDKIKTEISGQFGLKTNEDDESVEDLPF